MAEHKIEEMIATVNKTHAGLGEAVAFECIAVKAHKLILNIAPAGCGKSVASNLIAKHSAKSMVTDRLSVAGLQGIADELSNFNGVVVVDDISKTGTGYARIATVMTLAELVYSHFLSSHLSKLQFEVKDFHGSAIVNIQPVLLAALVASPEWEASIQDKAIRYYHLTRPVKPQQEPPTCPIDWGVDFRKVERPDMATPQGKAILHLARGQWRIARTLEHITDFLKAAAAMDGRTKVNQTDYKLIEKLLPPLRIEQAVLEKTGFESDRTLDKERLAVLTEFLTHGNFTVDQVSEDYGISKAQAYKNLANEKDDWIIVSKSPTTYAPSPTLLTLLTEVGIIGKNGFKPKGGTK